MEKADGCLQSFHRVPKMKKKSIVYSFKGEPEEKEVMTFENEMIKQYTFLKIKGDTKEWRKGVVGP